MSKNTVINNPEKFTMWKKRSFIRLRSIHPEMRDVIESEPLKVMKTNSTLSGEKSSEMIENPYEERSIEDKTRTQLDSIAHELLLRAVPDELNKKKSGITLKNFVSKKINQKRIQFKFS